MTYINKQGGIKSLSCNETAKQIWEFGIHSNTHISAAHIPGKHNILADFALRKSQDSAGWMLEPKIFDYVIYQFSKPEIDMFVSRLTRQIPIYSSWVPDPDSSLIDVFTINWNNIFIYAFPLFSIVWRMQESNSNSSTSDDTIMVYKDHETCNFTTYNNSQSIPQTSWNQSKTLTLSKTSDIGLINLEPVSSTTSV